ncbi:DUF6531 domain-containing protein [Dyella sp. GSA-30]|uniref:DUF6531 domain-containing protein n=1 Tax=Dyella sp. GSA-30 TaxID=2994496 RepID=UPI00248FA939|nr:DUF6531 domain-containing protein [Dyella sp. GSA-30]
MALMIQIIVLLPSIAQAQSVQNWGPPYVNSGWVADSTGYQTIPDAVAATVAEVASTCSPTPCATQVIYFADPLHHSTVVEVLGNPSAQFPTATFIDGHLQLQDPRKNAGGCEVCKEHNGGNSGASSPKHSSGDAAVDSGDVAGSTRLVDPINAATGNKYQQDTDFRSSKWLTFRRFYNSDNGVPSTAMGSHWRHSFDRSLQIIGTSTIVAMRPDGFGDAFTKSGSAWTADVDVADTFTEQDDGSGNATGYTLFLAAYRETEQYSAGGLLQSVTDSTGATETFAYSTSSTPSSVATVPGLLLTVTDPTGRVLNLTYDSSKRVHTVTLPDGGVLTYGYDSVSNLTSITFPDTKVLQYVYNESSLTGGANYPHAMTGTIDEKGTRFESTKYNGSAQAFSTSFAGGVDTSTISYGFNGPTLTTPLGNSVTFEYSTEVGQYRFVDYDFRSGPCGNECNQPWDIQSHDSNGYVSKETDLNGNVNAITNNSLGLETQRIAAQGKPEQRTINTTWDNNLRVPLTRQTLNASGVTVAQSAWVYNARGQVLASCEMDPAIPAAASYVCSNAGTVPAGVRRMVMTYCDAIDTTQCPVIGLMLTQAGPRTDVDDTIHYTYYMDDNVLHHHGDLATVTEPLEQGHPTTYIAYDGAGRVTTMADKNGIISNMSYTPRGWIASKTINPLGVDEATTSYTYTAYGALETVTDPDGVMTTYSYDDAHRLTKITDAQGNYIQYTLDVSGNRTAENIYTSGGTTPVHSLTRQFNKLGQLVKTIDGLNHTVFDASATGSYDFNGNLVQSVDGLGITHKQSVDAFNRVVSDVKNSNGLDTATQNTTVGNAYDALDRLTQVTDPSNLVTNYTYDGLSNQTGLQSPDTGASSDTFDAAGNRLTHTDARGVVSTSTYDALNRVLTLSFADATLNVAYHYDEGNGVTGCSNITTSSIGRVSRVVENNVTTTYCYDDRGNVIQKRQVQGAQTDTTTYAYTLADRLSQITYPSGTVVQYARNTLGQITSVTTTPSGGTAQTVVSNVTYLPFGPVSSYTLGNGQVVGRNYDANYQLMDLTSPNFNLHFTRDVMGDIASLDNASGVPTPIETYTYDPLYRLTGVLDSQGNAVETYTYNKTGDRLSKASTGGLATGTYGYQSGTHWLTSIGTAARSYDLNGNTTGNATGGQAFGFGYDGRNRLTVAQANNVTVGAYTYNVLGERVAKVTTSPGPMSVLPMTKTTGSWASTVHPIVTTFGWESYQLRRWMVRGQPHPSISWLQMAWGRRGLLPIRLVLRYGAGSIKAIRLAKSSLQAQPVTHSIRGSQDNISIRNVMLYTTSTATMTH